MLNLLMTLPTRVTRASLTLVCRSPPKSASAEYIDLNFQIWNGKGLPLRPERKRLNLGQRRPGKGLALRGSLMRSNIDVNRMIFRA